MQGTKVPQYYSLQPTNNFYNRGSTSNNIIGSRGFAQSDGQSAIANSIIVTRNPQDVSGALVNSIVNPSFGSSSSIIDSTGVAIGGGGRSAFAGNP